MRERLLKLHEEAYKKWQELPRGEPGESIPSFASYCTDYFVDRGALLPLIKCGQEIWCIEEKDKIKKYKVCAIRICPPNSIFFEAIDADCATVGFFEKSIGKTVFFSKAEAKNNYSMVWGNEK